MLVGLACALAVLVLVVAVNAAKNADLVLGRLDQVLRPIAEEAAHMGAEATLLRRELAALGFEPVGLFRPSLREEKPEEQPLRAVAVLAVLLSPDRRTEAVVSSTSIVFERKSARNALELDSLTLASYGPKDELVRTTNVEAADFLGPHPVNSWRRLPHVRDARALLAAHEAHVKERPLERVALDAAGVERRFALRHCEELWYLEARGLVRFDGDRVLGTRLLRLVSVLRVLGPGLGEARPRVALALHGVLAALGVLAAVTVLPRAGELATPFPYALFLVLATASALLFPRSQVGSPLLLCAPAALACHVVGPPDPFAWGAWALVFLHAVAVVTVRTRLAHRRAKARQERILAAVATAFSGAGASGSGGGPP